MDIYMRITNSPIPGDSNVKGFSNEFELYSLSYGAVNPGGKITVTPITVSLAAYNGPQLINAVADGRPHEIRFTIARSNFDGAPMVFETITLTGATITSFREMVNAGDDRPVLELAISYAGIQYTQNDIKFTFAYSKGGKF
ncbi:hypothetical protein EON82_04120 [bacterium]|nr:MAG: hypothetical protein EON82_04120 [bacterium]